MPELNYPDALRPHIRVALRWGQQRSGERRQALADEIEQDPAQLRELAEFAAAWPGSNWRILGDWARTGGEEAAHLASRFHALRALVEELELPWGPAENPIVSRIADLERCGSPLGRMHAALMLADHGEDAAGALPALRRAAHDPDPLVRISAHAALGVLTGNAREHRAVIQDIVREHGARDSLAGIDWSQHVLDYLDMAPAERDQRAFIGACIVGDLRQLTRLVGQVNVNALDRHGARPLGYAIGHTVLNSAEFLLQHGADPNLALPRNGNTPLHDAAWHRRGLEKVRLLLQYGANPLLRNHAGRSAAQIAHAAKRAATAELLKQAEAGAKE